MPSPNFEATLFDYLRIIFHRWPWIVGLIGVSVGCTWLWVEMMAEKKYRSDLVVLVWSKDQNIPTLRKMVERAPLASVINTIRDKLKVEHRLSLLVCNIRYGVKEDYARRLAMSGMPLSPERRQEWRSLLEEELANFPRILYSDGLSRRLDRKTFAANMDNQSLARVLGAVGADAGSLTDHMLTNAEGGDRYIRAMRKQLLPDQPGANPWEVRRMAEETLVARMARGAEAFDEASTLEMLREFLSIPRLLETKLYAVVDKFYSNERSLARWRERLSRGLNVSALHRNFITFQYWDIYDSPQEVITDLVVRVVFAMVEREYRLAADNYWSETEIVLQKEKEKIQVELVGLEKQIYDYDLLESIQLSTPDNGNPVVMMGSKPRSAGNRWADSFGSIPAPSVHVRRIDENIEELQEMNKQIEMQLAHIDNLQRKIDNKDLRTIPVSRPSRPDEDPRIRSYQNQLIQKELELSRITQTRTREHPFAVAVLKEIDELRTAISRLQPSENGAPAKKVDYRINPRLEEWKRDLDLAQSDLAQLKARRAEVEKIIQEEREKAKDAVLNQQEFAMKLRRRDLLDSMLSQLQKQEEELQARRRAGEGFTPIFEIHTNSVRPEKPFEPQKSLVLLLASVMGLLAAGTAVFILEYTDHSIKTAEDIKRFVGVPVLGEIPEFTFAQYEQMLRSSSRSRKPMDDSVERRLEYPDRAPGSTPTASGGLGAIPRGLVIAIVLALGLGVLYWQRGRVENLWQRAGALIERTMNAPEEGETEAPGTDETSEAGDMESREPEADDATDGEAVPEEAGSGA